jgi:hypothetical protein
MGSVPLLVYKFLNDHLNYKTPTEQATSLQRRLVLFLHTFRSMEVNAYNPTMSKWKLKWRSYYY